MDTDIYAVRKVNLKRLVDTRYDGVNASLAHDLGVTPHVINRALTDSDWRSNIGEKLARDIERVAGLQRGQLDQSEYEDEMEAEEVRFARVQYHLRRANFHMEVVKALTTGMR